MKEQVRELATEVWQTSHWTNEQIKRLERFAALVGNAKLEEAAKRFDDLNLYGTKTADTKGVAVILRNLKEPTP